MVQHAAWAPDNVRVVTALRDGTGRIWVVPGVEALMAEARRKISRPPSDEERQRFNLPEP
jgi:hypothetical protein